MALLLAAPVMGILLALAWFGLITGGLALALWDELAAIKAVAEAG